MKLIILLFDESEIDSLDKSASSREGVCGGSDVWVTPLAK
jgi:hypothetical protein